jgi:serine/threonine protein kinase
MLDENFQLKLLDFGLSKHCEQDDGSITELTLANSTLGTPGYMSPEQFSDAKNVDFKTDMFSLGATLYFLLTGEHPFCGDTLDVVYHSTIKNSPPPVEALAEYCSAQSINIIRRMMQKEPAKRYPSYDELLGDIIQLLCQLSDGQ